MSDVWLDELVLDAATGVASSVLHCDQGSSREKDEGYGVSIGKGWRLSRVSKTFFPRYHPGSIPEPGGPVNYFPKCA